MGVIVKIRIIVGILAALALTFVGVAPAQAATLKTTVNIEVPTYAGKNVASMIYVHVCSGTYCNYVNRSIGLFVDGKRVKTWTSAETTVSYSWKTSSVKKHTIQAKVLARSGYKAANSSAKTVTVKNGMLNTQSNGWYSYTQCGQSACTYFPAEVYPSDVMPSFFVWLGTDDRQYGRTAYLQWQKSDGTWVNDDYAQAQWDSDSNEYGVELRFDFDRARDCPDLDGSEYEYRVFIPSTSKATQTSGYYRAVHYNCGDTYPTTGSVVADFDYRNQYDITNPAIFWFWINDPNDVGSVIKTQYCMSDDVDCTLEENWYDYDSYEYYSSPDDWISLGVHPEYYSVNELIRAVVIPSDGSTPLYSPVYSGSYGES